VFEVLAQLLVRPFTEILLELFDVLIVAFIVYRGLLVLRGTRAMQMGIGFVALGLLYVVAEFAQLALLENMLSWLAPAAPIIIVVVFQNDIRRALIRVGSKAWFTRGHDAQERVIDEVVAAATELARHRMGALICLERDANVLEFVKSEGIELDSMVTRELLVSLFIPESMNKAHDGAVLIRDLRIARAGIFFPMPESTRVADLTLGSRHRAAIGITEETDALVIAVSEERGTITLVFKDGTMVPSLTGPALRKALMGLFGRVEKKERKRDRLLRFGRRLTSSKAQEKERKRPPEPSKEKVKEANKGDQEKTEKADKPKVASRSSVATRASTPPPAIKKEANKRSGSFNAQKTGEEKSAGIRLSVPMPSAKDRKTDEPEPSTTPSTPPPTNVSKPMTPADLPTTTIVGDDS
jgi:diadenylate cyclase